MVAKVSDPYPVFYDLEGDPLEAGYIYIGEYELDPVGNPKPAYWDVALTVPAAQPVRTLAGRPVNEGSQIGVLYVSGEYSILVQDNLEQLVVSDDVETCKTFAERAEAAAAAALAGNVYLTRTEAEATVIPIEANLIWVFHDDVPCLFQRSETEAALTTLGSVTWKAAEGKDSYLQHWGVSTYDTRELARTAVTSMTTIERTAHQAAIERAYLDAEGTLMLNGWVEVLDEIIVGQRCVPDVIDGIAGESLSCGLFFTSRFNMTADSCYTAGATGAGSYAPYIKGLSIALDISEAETAGQLAYSVVVAPATVERIAAYDAAIASGSTVSEAEEAGQLAYDNYLTANPLVLPAAIAASNVDFGVALPNYPPAFVGKEAFGVLETARITGMCRDSSSKWIAPTFGATNDDNVGGWEIKNLQLSGVDQDLRIENGFHFLKLGRVDDWVWDLGPRAQDYRNRDVTAGVKREAMYFGRLDSLIADHVGMFQGGQIVYDKGEGNSITDQFGNVQLDGDGASLTLRSGRSQFGRLYGTEDVSVPSLGNKVLCQAGTHIIATGSLIGDADALIEVTGGRLEYDGILRNTNINGHGGLVTGGQLVFDGAHFVVGIVGSFDYSDWNVGYIQQSGTGELVVTASCTAEQFTGGGVVQGPSVQTWLAVKVTANNPGCNIEPSPRTRAEMVLALSGVAYCLFPIKGSRVYHLDGLDYLGNSGATGIPDLLGLVPLGNITPLHFGELNGVTDHTIIQAAETFVNGRGGGVVYLGPHAYVGTARPTNSLANVWFFGEGPEATSYTITAYNAAIWPLGVDCSLFGVTVDGGSLQDDARKGAVIRYSARCVVRDTVAQNGYTGYGPSGANASDSAFYNIKAKNCLSRGWQANDQGNNNVVYGFQAIACGKAVVRIAYACHGNKLFGVHATGCNGTAGASIWIAQGSYDNLISGLILESPAGPTAPAIQFDSNAYRNTVENFRVNGHSRIVEFDGQAMDALAVSLGISEGNTRRNTVSSGVAIGVTSAPATGDRPTHYAFNWSSDGTYDASANTVSDIYLEAFYGVGKNGDGAGSSVACDGSTIKDITNSDIGAGGVLKGMKSPSDRVYLKRVEGFPLSAVVDGSIGVTSTGLATAVIAHGLGWTPPEDDCTVRVVKVTAVGDYRFDTVHVAAAPGVTSVTARCNISTASATGGATASLSVDIHHREDVTFPLSRVTP
tara:strand:- start:2840 stop:6436 length:3597 start_codon:yes stop_codon:yes gene_type:complete